MANIQKRINKKGKVSYTALIRIKGYPTMSATFARKTDATIWANEKEAMMKKGKRIKDAEAQRHTLEELIDRYIEEKLPERKTNKESFKAQLNWWRKRIGKYLLSEITPALLSKYKNILKNEPNVKATLNVLPKTGATVNRYLAALSIVFTKAYKEWEWMEENPMLKVEKYSETSGRTRFLSQEEQERLLKACQESRTPLLYLLVVLALSTGARRGEIINITWDFVKFNDEEKSVTLYLMDTKNKEHRSVTIDNLGYKLLKEHSKVRRIDTKFVFARADGKKPYDLRNQWEIALKKANLKDFRFHDLRHTTASNLAMSGASLRDIAEILGHKTMQMTQRYSHLTKKYSTKILSELNKRQFNTAN